MSRRMTQVQRVEQLLRRRGEHGITAKDFMPPTADGLSPIWRCAARVNELRQTGHVIETRLEQQGGARVAHYFLIGEERVTVPVSAAPSAPDELLPAAPQSAVLGWDA
jgi:hypothetical protein